MKLLVRLTHAFAEIKVDEIETTIFEIREIDETIENLADAIDDLLILKKRKEALIKNQTTHT